MNRQLLNRGLSSRKLYAFMIAFLVTGFTLFSQQNYAQTGTWTRLTSKAPHKNGGEMLVLSDGSIIAKAFAGGTDAYGNIYDKLTPDATGSYANGTWSSINPMHGTRLYYSTQLLKDGRVYVAGGEYGTGGSAGETYDPLTNVWTSCPSPGGFVSDANSEILPDGRLLQSLVGLTTGTKLYNPTTNTYAPGPNALGGFNESMWVKLPDQSILYVNINSHNSERYIPSLNQWVADATVPVSLYDPFGEETGPGFLLPDGRAFFIGSPNTSAYYTPSGTNSPGTWAAGPALPTGKGAPDAPAALMVNGKILCVLSPQPTSANHFPSPTSFYEFDYLTNTFTAINTPQGKTSVNTPTYVTAMLDLPNGQVLCTFQDSLNYYVYTPNGSPLAAGKPVISGYTQTGGCTSTDFSLTGTGFNGISEGSAYGDDWQMESNYPIVRLTSGSNVYYARSSNWNSTGVMRGAAKDTAKFVTPAGLPSGTYSLYVIANGIASDPISFSTSFTATITPLGNLDICGTGSVDLQGNGAAGSTYQWKLNGVKIIGATNQIYTATAAGKYKVTINTGDGCKSTSKATKVIKSCEPNSNVAMKDVSGLTIADLKISPNPVSDLSTISFSIPQSSHVNITVYDVNGREIQELTNADLASGSYTTSLNATNLAKGMYFVRMITGSETQNVKFIVQ